MSSGVDRSTLFVLLGSAGDLARRLVVPALFELDRDGALPEQFRLLGVDRSELGTGALAETLGVEHRGGYYEGAGALRDMVQNHLMQLLCLIAMEPPSSFDADRLRDRKMEVMRALRPIPPDRVSDFAARGQYGSGWVGASTGPVIATRRAWPPIQAPKPSRP
jgi:glucose-6-phosphate 1-dehydrogenase